MKKSLFIFIILLFSFCSKRDSQYPHITFPESKNAVQVNTKGMLHISSDNVGTFFMPNFERDTSVSKNPRWDDKHVKKYNYNTVFQYFDFKIIIDTSYTLAVKGFEYKNIDLESNGYLDFNKVFSLWKDNVVCYPLLIYNNSNKPAYSYSIKLIQQAKDRDGKWKPIEYFANAPSCLPNPFCYEHLPKKYTALSIIKYNGDFKTKIRVKVKIGKYVYYSNEIEGHINETQFDRGIARERLKFMGHFSRIIFVTKERLSYVFLENTDH